MNLREKAQQALEAYDEQKKLSIQDYQDTFFADIVKRFSELTGSQPETVRGLKVFHDDMVFIYNPKYKCLRLLYECPKCGEEAESWDIRSLSDLGKQLQDPQPHNHYCKQKSTDLTELKKLIDHAHQADADLGTVEGILAVAEGLLAIATRLEDGIQTWRAEY